MTLGLSTPCPAHKRRTTSRGSVGERRNHQRPTAPATRRRPTSTAATLEDRPFLVFMTRHARRGSWRFYPPGRRGPESLSGVGWKARDPSGPDRRQRPPLPRP